MVRVLRYVVLCSLLVGTVKAANVSMVQQNNEGWRVTLQKIKDGVKSLAGRAAQRAQESAANDGEPVLGKAVQKEAEGFGEKVVDALKKGVGAFGNLKQDGRTFDGAELNPEDPQDSPIQDPKLKIDGDKAPKTLTKVENPAKVETPTEVENKKGIASTFGAGIVGAATKATALVTAHPYMAVGGAIVTVAAVWAAYKLKHVASCTKKTLTEQEELEAFEQANF